MEKRRPLRDLLYTNFNQDFGCFAVGANNGFRVYNCEPFKETFRREFLPGGIAIVEMLFRCNILALVGGGMAPKYPPNKVMIWDDHQGRCIGELSFRSQVRAVRLRRDRIAVALEHKVLVYNFADLRLLHTIETLSNPGGVLALSPSADQTVLACPGLHVGQVRVELYDTRRTKFIAAHNTGVQCLTLSSNGKLLATASEKGTLVRVFSTGDGSKLQEVRRGSDPARIYSLAFSRGEWPDWLAATSDKGTAHVFSLRKGMGQGASAGSEPSGGGGGGGSATSGGGGGGGNGAAVAAGSDVSSVLSRANPTSALSFVSSYLPVGGSYFASERSFAQFRLPETCPVIVGFSSSPCTLLLVSATGCFHRVGFDGERGGACEQLAFTQFMEDMEEEG